MGRPSKYTNHPLFRLRESLGKDEPIKQVDLAVLLDVPLLSIQALEAGRRGRRGIATPLLQKIRRQTGSLWDPTTAEWLFDQRLLFREVQPGRQYAPLTPELFAAYRENVTTPLSQEEKAINLFLYQAWISELFKRVSDKDRSALLSRLSVFVEQCCRDFRFGDPVEFFSKVSTDTQPVTDAMSKELAQKKTDAELGRLALSILKRQLPELGPDSEAGQDILWVHQKLANILKSFPEAKSTTKPGRKRQPKSG